MAGYGADDGFTSWLADNGLTLPDGAPTLAVLRNRGSGYVDAAYGDRLFCSAPAGGVSQERAWPRTGASAYGQAVDSAAIPLAWVNASYRAAWLIASNPDAFTATINPSARVKRQKVDVIEREFFDNGALVAGSGALSVLDAEIDGLVAPYLCLPRATTGLGIWAVGS